MPNHLKVTVYYSDTDCGGVVYYANYLKYMEHGRMELFRGRGINLTDLHHAGTMFVVAETNVKYRRPAKLGDDLDVETTVAAVSSVTMTIQTRIFNQLGTLLVTASTRMACVNEAGKLKTIPEEITTLLSAEHGAGAPTAS